MWLQYKVVQSTEYFLAHSSWSPASSVYILAEEDGTIPDVSPHRTNYWAAESGKTTGQGFTLRVDYCPRMIAGLQIKNARNTMNGPQTSSKSLPLSTRRDRGRRC